MISYTVWRYLLCGWLWILNASRVDAIDLDVKDPDSIKAASSQLARDLVSYYTGDQPGDVPGNLPSPYYWWEAGAYFGALVNYWAYTGDDSYNEITTQAILHQVGGHNDFMPTNQTRTEGNDDQSFWAFTAMSAAETNFPNPDDDEPSWLALAQAVFNEQTRRWDEDTCAGGLKWQIYSFNSGYEYKNSISNGCLFDLGARLARYTGNNTYAEWAEKAWDWAAGVGVIGDRFEIYDGTSSANNCSDINHMQWSYNNGVFLHGAAHMWNYTSGSSKWGDRVQNLLNAQQIFFSHNKSSSHVMYESACEHDESCTTDQTSFKAYLARWMGDVAKVAPFTYKTIMKRLQKSATAAAAQCTGGDSGTQCGTRWTTGSYDGSPGIGQQLSALEVVQVTLLDSVTGPLTGTTGGSSTGDSSAGTGASGAAPNAHDEGQGPSHKDRVGAGILTAVIVILIIGCEVFMLA